jgi:hypothetical protein
MMLRKGQGEAWCGPLACRCVCGVCWEHMQSCPRARAVCASSPLTSSWGVGAGVDPLCVHPRMRVHGVCVCVCVSPSLPVLRRLFVCTPQPQLCGAFCAFPHPPHQLMRQHACVIFVCGREWPRAIFFASPAVCQK